MSSPHIFISHSWQESKSRNIVSKVKTWLSHTPQFPSSQIVNQDTGRTESVFNRPTTNGRLGQYVITESTNPVSGPQRKVREALLEQISKSDIVVLLVDQTSLESNYIAWELLCASSFLNPQLPIFGLQYKGLIFDPYSPGLFPIERYLCCYATCVGDVFLDSGALMQNVEAILQGEKLKGNLHSGRQRDINMSEVNKLIEVDNVVDHL